MDIKKRNRSELKSYFVKNSIPTESNFSDLIDAGLNQKEDGIAKPAGDPLSIEAAGDASGLQKLVNFYASFQDANPAWTFQLNPRSDAGNPATAKPGFCLSNGQGQARLFIDQNTGNVGIGTITPSRSFDVKANAIKLGLEGNGGGQLILANNRDDNCVYMEAFSKDGTGHASEFLLTGRAAENVPKLSLRADTTTITGNLGVGTQVPKSSLEIRKDASGALGPVLTLSNNAGSAGAGTAVDFNTYDVGNNPPSVRIQTQDDGNYSGHLLFLSKENGAANKPLRERLRILSNGKVGIGTTEPRTALDTGSGVMSGAANDYQKAQFSLSGGGLVTWGGPGGRLKWTARFIGISMERTKTFASGYVDIVCPTNGLGHGLRRLATGGRHPGHPVESLGGPLRGA
ncbi:hypothetical protein [Methylogaea oryzae]|uniref:hypothetical protein n=1 Tax=Methylogaea oryzae TaxID=1295382 RepID=UPI0006D01F8C|nr:hypothetical protein [Methylogaea oryzae]